VLQRARFYTVPFTTINMQNSWQPSRLGSLSVFYPAYNDEGSIRPLVEKTLQLLPSLTGDFEIIVVNDGSRDNTAAILDAMARELANVRVVHHPHNRGYGGALRTGLMTATKEWVFYTDGDAQYDVNELRDLAALIRDDVDVVNGYKLKRSDNRQRIILGGIYKRLSRLLFNLPIRDVDCDFRLMRRAVIQSIDLRSTSGVVCTEMIYKLTQAGARFVETPVHHYARQHGQSQFFTWRRVSKTAGDFFALWLKMVVLPRISFGLLGPRKPAPRST
jgi:glycosyltransferase involved in cell wall biosynthesis